MPEISNVKPNVDLIEHEGKKFYIVGTAHVSKQSAELVEECIREYAPDSVAVELCQPRYESLTNPEHFQNTDIYNVIRSGKAYVLMAQVALAAFQKKLGDELDVRPGEEMRRAIEVTEDVGANIVLADREVKLTLKRAWAGASLWSLMKFGFSIFVSLFSSEEITEEEIEALKSSDALTTMMSTFASHLPGIKTALVDERDEYLAAKIAESPGDTTVAVVGAAHVPGIKRVFGSNIDVERLEQVPPPRLSTRAIGWGIPLLIVAMIVYGFVESGAETSGEMVKIWIIANGSLSALGALIALAHPLTVVTAFIVAPITSLNPMIAAGWVCGLVEACLRKPRVKDLETVADDVTTMRGIWQNRVSKILLVMAFANLGSVAGTVIGAGNIASLLQS